MKAIAFAVAFFVLAVNAAEKNDAASDKPKTYRRLIPADVLRGEFLRI